MKKELFLEKLNNDKRVAYAYFDRGEYWVSLNENYGILVKQMRQVIIYGKQLGSYDSVYPKKYIQESSQELVLRMLDKVVPFKQEELDKINDDMYKKILEQAVLAHERMIKNLEEELSKTKELKEQILNKIVGA